MSLKVAKFGGSSVADAFQLAKLKSIVENDEDIKYVIVSAPGKRFPKDTKVTDLLYLCKEHVEQNISYDQVFSVIRERYDGIKKELSLGLDLDSEFDRISNRFDEDASADYVASRGEYLCARLTAEYLGMEFVDTAGLIQFDNRGKLLVEETNNALKEELSLHERAVLPGFYGSVPNGEIKTFTRGGSDITGALVARAVEADVYENWTDVSGFLMADPRIVENPKPIKRVSYSELRELSYMGASVLHEDAVFPAKKAGIPINIRNTNEPGDPGTMITIDTNQREDKGIITGIAGSRDFTVIGLYKNMLAGERGFVRKLAGILEDHNICLEHLPSGIDTLSVVVRNSMLGNKLEEIIDEFEKQLHPDKIEINENVALIATVGEGMSYRTGVSAKLFTALADANINIRMIDQGSSEMNIIVGVENKDLENAVRAIYNAFVG